MLATHRKFAKDVLLSNLPIPFTKLRAYVWMAIFATTLGTGQYGEWAMVILTLSIVNAIATLNQGSALMRFVSGSRSRQEVSQAWAAALLTVSICAAGCCSLIGIAWPVFSPLIFGGVQSSVPGWAMAWALLADVLYEQSRGLLRARRLNDAWATLTLLRLIPEMVVTTTVVLVFGTVTATLIAYASCSSAAAVLGITLTRLRYGFGISRPDWAVVRKFSHFGIALLPGVIARLLATSIDRYVVASYLGLQQVGLYAIAVTISGLAFFLLGPMNDVLFPELSDLYDTCRWNEFHARLRQVQKLLYAVAWAAATLLVTCPSELLLLCSKVESPEASTALALLGIQGIFMLTVLFQCLILTIRLRVWLTSTLWVSYATATLCLALILVPKYGLVGAALAQLTASSICATALLYVNRAISVKVLKISWFLKSAISMAVVYYTLQLISESVREQSGGAALVRLLTAAVGFGGAMLLTRYYSIRELNSMLELAKSIFRLRVQTHNPLFSSTGLAKDSNPNG